MKQVFPLVAGVVLTGVVTAAAFAQAPAAGKDDPGTQAAAPQAPAPPQEEPPFGPQWMRHRGPGMLPPPPPPFPPMKGAFFHMQRGDVRIDIKCADNEPMKACVDAAEQLLDKLAATH